jgi:hypothetical protein
LTVPDTSEGPGGATVCVTVTVGAGDGSEVAGSLDVGSGEVVGDGSSMGASEVGPSFTLTAGTEFTLKVTDDEAKEPEEGSAKICGGIHYRPQLKATARARMVPGTMNATRASPRAGAAEGAATDIE